MISLHVYLTAKTGRDSEIECAIRDKWLSSMSEQPGFISAAVVKPLPSKQLAELGAVNPQWDYETICFWKSEKERLEWVSRPIHDQVFGHVLKEAENVTYTVQTVELNWNL